MRPFRPFVVFALAALTTGCQRWQPELRPIPEVTAPGRVEAVRITREDGHRVVLYTPVLAGDTLLGSRRRPKAATPFELGQALAPEDRIAIGLSDVRGVESRHPAAGRTALLVIGIGLAAALALAVAVAVSLQGGLLP